MSRYVTRGDIASIERWIQKLESGDAKKISDGYVAKKLDLPYRVIGSGKHRIVYDLENGYVLKVAKADSGIVGNDRETSLYFGVSPPLQKHLCKIVDYGHGWLVMEKLDRQIPKGDSHKKQLDQIASRFSQLRIKLSDLKRANLRYNDDKDVVIVDYANYKSA